jgi:butyrate kinase
MKTLVIAPREFATDISVFDDDDELISETVGHQPSEIYSFRTPEEQGRYRCDAISRAMESCHYPLRNIESVITQIESYYIPPGIYMIEGSLLERVADDLPRENQYSSGVFAANMLSALIMERYGAECIPLAVEPVVADEIVPVAALSGVKGVTRAPRYNALAQRAALAFYAYQRTPRATPNDINVIIAHLGSEISVGAYSMGRLIDCCSPRDGEGPFSPQTSGAIPLDKLIGLCYSGKYDMDEMLLTVSERCGLAAYLGDASLDSVSAKCRAGDKKARFLVEAMAVKTSQEIGAKASSLRGQAEAVLLTGAWAGFDEFTETIRSMVEWIAPVKTMILKNEMWLLAHTALETYKGHYKILLYGRDRG